MGEVEEVESCYVAPSEETPRQPLWLSPLDVLLANRGHTPTVYLYQRDAAAAVAGGGFFEVGRLKKAMAKALVAFYPLAGRLRRCAGGGRPEIDCNAEGALFVVARSSELTVDAFSDLKPSPELRRLFVPRIEPASIVLGVQVTFLSCGGVALGTVLHHSAIDALSAFHFFLTWSSYCRYGDAAAVDLPCHERTLLRARSPPVVHPDAHAMFSLKLNLRDEPTRPVSTKIFDISEGQLAALRQTCGGTSTFCAVSALVWQCACVARRLPLSAETRLTFPVNIRRRVRPPLPDRYFGNALVVVSAASTVEDVVSGTLAATAALVRATLRRADDEMLRSAIDHGEMMVGGRSTWNPPAARGNLPDTELRVTSWLGMPVYDADFGWGKPLVMSRAESVRGGFVYVMDGAGGDASGGGVRVLMCMEAVKMEEFKRLIYARFG
ncbi:putrescine hydroxycinnamoyltransferase 1-like [Oryza brachyantha]|uniref:putrescine hydroxycinnamoyltransferase 1-like n=1 Tax=Oryza brachyantha TaxID=4533 RepID=UPI0003EAA765|nr:putrescine hydroxycinnamoyltransferase 1-like [Oryza brachyantha]